MIYQQNSLIGSAKVLGIVLSTVEGRLTIISFEEGHHVALTASQMAIVIVKDGSLSWMFSIVISKVHSVLLTSGFWKSFVSVRIRCVPTTKSTIFLLSCGTSTAGRWKFRITSVRTLNSLCRPRKRCPLTRQQCLQPSISGIAPVSMSRLVKSYSACGDDGLGTLISL